MQHLDGARPAVSPLFVLPQAFLCSNDGGADLLASLSLYFVDNLAQPAVAESFLLLNAAEKLATLIRRCIVADGVMPTDTITGGATRTMGIVGTDVKNNDGASSEV
ncbi:hypothetical protein TcCL_NonESM08494 [Trypanosoma cruzi]|nr:hypothetical protein TcCL_NonESM08494 [Trypanosoma cruzi]